MKEWECVQVNHHKDVGRTIEQWESNGWRLHTYVCAGNAVVTLGTNHYLLFERETKKSSSAEAAAAAAAAVAV